MNKFFFFGGLFVSLAANAQLSYSHTVLANDGGYKSTPQGSIAWTIGEPVIDTYTKPGNITTMGFHQPEVDVYLAIGENSNDMNVLVYPNPVRDELSVSFPGISNGKYSMELTDDLGKLIYKMDADVKHSDQRFSLKLSDVAAGTYYLRVSGNNFSKAVKINKVY